MTPPLPSSAPKSPTVVDLTHRLVSGHVPACHGHPKYKAELVCSIVGGDSANFHALTLGTHTGTHIDAPYHFFPNGDTVDVLDLSLLAAARAVVVDVRHRGAHERIVWSDIAHVAQDIIRLNAQVALLCTGWDSRWGRDDYSDHPFLDPEVARTLIRLGVRVIGLDTLSPDEVTADTLGEDVHRVVLEDGGIIVENMTQLNVLLERGWTDVVVSLLPLKLDGCDGSPVRAVAWQASE